MSLQLVEGTSTQGKIKKFSVYQNPGVPRVALEVEPHSPVIGRTPLDHLIM